jgi:O-acetyl-ADP-ribose deacetylase
MRLIVKQGDVLDEAVDVLICTANALLRMSGGVNGAILARGGKDVQNELNQYLKQIGRPAVDRGSVVRTGPGPLAVKHILHAVGVNAFYESSADVIASLVKKALAEAAALGAKTVATPAIATGYGPLTMAEFARGLREAVRVAPPGIQELRVVLRKPEEVDEVRQVCNFGTSGGQGPSEQP